MRLYRKRRFGAFKPKLMADCNHKVEGKVVRLDIAGEHYSYKLELTKLDLEIITRLYENSEETI